MMCLELSSLSNQQRFIFLTLKKLEPVNFCLKSERTKKLIIQIFSDFLSHCATLISESIVTNNLLQYGQCDFLYLFHPLCH